MKFFDKIKRFFKKRQSFNFNIDNESGGILMYLNYTSNTSRNSLLKGLGFEAKSILDCYFKDDEIMRGSMGYLKSTKYLYVKPSYFEIIKHTRNTLEVIFRIFIDKNTNTIIKYGDLDKVIEVYSKSNTLPEFSWSFNRIVN